MVAVMTAWALLTQVPSIAGLALAEMRLRFVAAQLVSEAVPEATPSLVSAEAVAPQPPLSAGRARSLPVQLIVRCSSAYTTSLSSVAAGSPIRSPSDHCTRYPVEPYRVVIAAGLRAPHGIPPGLQQVRQS